MKRGSEVEVEQDKGIVRQKYSEVKVMRGRGRPI